MEQLTYDKKVLILVSLRNGDGFSTACKNAGLSPENMTLYCREYPSFSDECKDYISAGVTELLQQRQKHMKDNDYDAVKKVDDLRNRFVDKLFLWKCAGKQLSELQPEIAIQVYKRAEEVATAYGMTYEAYLLFVKRKSK